MANHSESGKKIHASCVAVGPSAILIMGSSGSGKSALALELMSRGAELVADDRTYISVSDDVLTATCPPAIAGQIEARGLGILAAEYRKSAAIRLVVDLDKTESKRYPPVRELELLGVKLPLLYNPEASYFPAALLQYLKGGRIE
ncbi:MAG: HPr kinase/phosphorylase [Paracoccaceae bacterium]